MNEEQLLHWIADNDNRYHPNAYVFTLEALRYTQHLFRKPRHVSGQQLLVGVAKHAKEKYGTLAWPVLQEWGIAHSKDFGNIVFNLVEIGEIKKTDDDSLDDFDTGFDLKKELSECEVNS